MKRLGVAGDPVSTRKLERDKIKQAISFAQRAETMPRASARGKVWRRKTAQQPPLRR